MKSVASLAAMCCFLADLPLTLGYTIYVWAIGAFLGTIAMPALNVDLTASMRIKAPVEL